MSVKNKVKSWYGVRCIFVDLRTTDRFYEERITVWRAKSLRKAIALAEIEAAEYADFLSGWKYTGLAQAFRCDGKPVQGSEVYSLIRQSNLEISDYLDQFFDTGTEVQSAPLN